MPSKSSLSLLRGVNRFSSGPGRCSITVRSRPTSLLAPRTMKGTLSAFRTLRRGCDLAPAGRDRAAHVVPADAGRVVEDGDQEVSRGLPLGTGRVGVARQPELDPGGGLTGLLHEDVDVVLVRDRAGSLRLVAGAVLGPGPP